jgi:uncharacterized membrane protein YqgA involved in biofilm formation
MIATFINCGLIILGSLLGLLLRDRISARFTTIVTQVLALCVLSIGFSSAIATNNTLCVIVCIVLGSLLGEALRIEERLDDFGNFLRSRLIRGDGGEHSRFTEGFVTASVLFCVGAMAVMGAIEAGVNGNYSILISKSVIDGITAITFAAAMGIGVAFSAIPILLYQGGLTLLAGFVSVFLTGPMITEMSAVGGVIIVGIGINMLGFTSKKLKVGNMLPAIFLPLLYLPVETALSGLFSRLF